MKRLIAIILAVAMCVPMLCINVSAASAYSVKMSCAYGAGYTYVTLSVADGDIRYTTDGSAPTASSALYTGKIKVTEPSKLRMAVYDNGSSQARYSAKINVKVKYPTATLSGTSGASYVYNVTAPKGARVYYTTDGTAPYTNNGKQVTGGKITVPAGSTLKMIAIKGGWIKSAVRTVNVPADKPSSSATAASEYVTEVVRLVNAERAKYGLAALEMSDSLNKAAQERSKELATIFSHDRPDGSSCFTILKEYDISYYCAAENIAAGQRTPEQVVQGWMNSSGHRGNILSSSFRYIGIGYTKTDSGYQHYWSQLFIG